MRDARTPAGVSQPLRPAIPAARDVNSVRNRRATEITTQCIVCIGHAALAPMTISKRGNPAIMPNRGTWPKLHRADEARTVPAPDISPWRPWYWGRRFMARRCGHRPSCRRWWALSATQDEIAGDDLQHSNRGGDPDDRLAGGASVPSGLCFSIACFLPRAALRMAIARRFCTGASPGGAGAAVPLSQSIRSISAPPAYHGDVDLRAAVAPQPVRCLAATLPRSQLALVVLMLVPVGICATIGMAWPAMDSRPRVASTGPVSCAATAGRRSLVPAAAFWTG